LSAQPSPRPLESPTMPNALPMLDGMCVKMNRACTRYQLLEPLTFLHFNIEIPPYYICDGASIPKWLGFWLTPIGRYLPAAFLHDYLYDCHRQIYEYNNSGLYPNLVAMKRSEADGMFLEQMRRDGVGWRTRYTMYYAVRLFGWIYWDKKSP